MSISNTISTSSKVDIILFLFPNHMPSSYHHIDIIVTLLGDILQYFILGLSVPKDEIDLTTTITQIN